MPGNGRGARGIGAQGDAGAGGHGFLEQHDAVIAYANEIAPIVEQNVARQLMEEQAKAGGLSGTGAGGGQVDPTGLKDPSLEATGAAPLNDPAAQAAETGALK